MRLKNRKNKSLTIAILIISIISATILYAGIISFVPLETKDRSSENSSKEMSYSPDLDDDLETIITSEIIEDPIFIDDNAENNWEWAKNEYNLPGSGTVDDPYLIMDLIVGSISIENSDAYFRIENCKTGISLSNTNNGELININASNQWSIGIYLENSHYNIVSGNDLGTNEFGISLIDSSHNIISGNTADTVLYGIYLRNSHYNIIAGNTILNNYDGAIILVGCTYNDVFDNTISNNIIITTADYPIGIYIGSYFEYITYGESIYIESKYNMISENYISNQEYGIYIYDASQNILRNNRINDNDLGIYLAFAYENIITENNIADNGRGIKIANEGHNIIYLNSFYHSLYSHIFYFDYPNIIPGTSWDKDGLGNYWDDYTGVDADEDGIGDTPYEIRQLWSGEYECDNYPLIDPYESESEDPPIHIYAHESPIYIDDNAENNWAWAKNEYNLPGSGTENDPYIIQNFIIDGGGSAVGSCISIKNSDAYFKIENCKLHGSGFGGFDAAIRLRNTDNGEIIKNDISQNLYGSYGIYLWRSNENDIKNNILVENFFGIILSDSDDNDVTENTLIDHYVGIIIAGPSTDNIIYPNSFYGTIASNVYYV